jgi:RNA polymerase sigma-70 factor (ECF subfamily)
MGDRGQPLYDGWLVLRAQAGEVGAFDELLARWQERLWRYARRLLGDDEAAWDASQEAWLAMARDLRRLGAPDAFPAWAYRVVSNKARDLIRRERRRRRGHSAFAELEAAQAGGGPEAGADAALSLEQALLALPEQDRAIVALRHLEGFDTRQTAAILGIPEGTAKSRLHAALNRLRVVLEGQCDE